MALAGNGDRELNNLLQIAVTVLFTGGAGAATLSLLNTDVPDLEVPDGAWVAGPLLDGQTFRIDAVDLERGLRLVDDIIFRDGAFQSIDCQNYCDFGWSDYSTQVVDDVIHFTVRTICPDAPHTVVWHGRVEGDEIAIDVSWTTRRWYWTTQFLLAGTGQRVPGTASDNQG